MTKAYKIILTFFILLALASAGAAAYFYREASLLKANPQASTQRETEELVARVGKIILLPQGETPTVATVFEPEKLKDQIFFTNAQKGDKVLIYNNAKKAILYNPQTNKIVEVAPVNIGDENQQAVQNTSPTQNTGGEGVEDTPPSSGESAE